MVGHKGVESSDSLTLCLHLSQGIHMKERKRFLPKGKEINLLMEREIGLLNEESTFVDKLVLV